MQKNEFLSQVQSAYDSGIKAYAQNWGGAWPWMDVVKEKFSSILNAGATIADIGCNVGYDSNYFASRGFKVTGFDFCENALTIAKKQFQDIEFNKANILELSKLNRQFDGLWISMSLLHIPISLIDHALQEIKTLTHSQSSVMLIMAKAPETFEEAADLKMKDKAGNDQLVPLVRWNEDDFKVRLKPFFQVLWQNTHEFAPGRVAWMLLLKPL